MAAYRQICFLSTTTKGKCDTESAGTLYLVFINDDSTDVLYNSCLPGRTVYDAGWFYTNRDRWLFPWSRYTRSGLAQKGNKIYNTSGVLTSLMIAQQLSEKDKNKVAFAFVDDGCQTQLGARLLKESLNGSSCIRVYLDSIGNKGDMVCMGHVHPDLLPEVHERPSDLEHLGDLLVTCGQLENDKVRVYKDDVFQMENIEICSKTILSWLEKIR